MPERQERQQGPGQGARDPAVPALLPERRDREGERDRKRSEAQEHHGRMDHHPGVLEERVQSDPVRRRRRREQLERALLAEDRDDAEEGREIHDHHRGLLLLGAAPDEEADDRSPEAPEEEGALLARPEGRDQEMERQIEARVRVDVGHVESVLEQQRHLDGRGRDDRQRERRVGRARQGKEILPAAVHAQVRHRRGETREESPPDRRDAGPEIHQEVLPGGGAAA